jgi:hypothetical protein
MDPTLSRFVVMASAAEIGKTLADLENHVTGGKWAEVLGDMSTLAADAGEIWQGFEEGGGHLMAAESPQAAEAVRAKCDAVRKACQKAQAEHRAGAVAGAENVVGAIDPSKIAALLQFVQTVLPFILSLFGK